MFKFRRSSAAAFVACASLLGFSSDSLARPAPLETEPNDTKAAANLVVPLTCLPIFAGFTTGNSTTTPGLGSVDYFRVTVTGTPGVITEHVWTLSSGTPGHTMTVRGLTQTNGVPNAGTDGLLQFSAVSGTDRVCRVYTLGASQDVYCAVTGTAATTSMYFVDHACNTVAPIVIPGVLRSGSITVTPTAGADAAADTDFWVYDSSLNALPDFGHDDADSTGATRTLAPGVYYIAFSNFNTANNLGSPIDDTFRTGEVTDFAGVVVNTSAGLIADTGVQVSDGFGTTLTGAGAKSAAFQVVWYQFTVGITSEAEANESKATATAVTPSCGDRLTGTTTGTSTTVAGVASADTFLISTPAAAPGIYLNTLTLTSATPGHIASVRGLDQTAGAPVAGTDVSVQSSTILGTDRINRFYSFGPSSQLYYRVTGVAATTAPYSTTLTCAPVTPIAVSTSLQAGPITIRRGTGNTTDTDWWVYDSSFNPLPDFGHDEPDSGAITRTLAPGVYYIAMGAYNTANNLPSPIDDTDRTSNLMDFAGVLASGSTTISIVNMNVEILDTTGAVVTGVGSRNIAFEVVWYRFAVDILPEVEPNDTKAAATPAAMECGYSITGTTTGTSATVAGVASADNFLLAMPPASPGIYEHMLTLTSTIPGHTATLRGLTQTAGVPNAGTDTTIQSSTVIGTDRVSRFYSLGGPGQLYYRVTGTVATTAPYRAMLSCTPVTPIPVSTQVRAGPITVRPTAAADVTADIDFWVYDAAFNPLPDFGHDDADSTGATRTLAPGVYYIAFGNFNTANSLGSPADDTFRTGAVMDFGGVVANSTTSVISNMSVEVADSFGTLATGVGAKTAAFQVVWYTFTVWSAAEIEANDTKAAAQPVYPACGAAITGTTTGSDTAGGATSADTFLVTTPLGAPGIYLNTLTLASPTPAHTASLRGLTQTAGVINPGTDATLQAHALVGTDRVNKFYSFGTGGQMYYRVTGTAAKTAAYTTTLTCTPVTPIVIGTPLGAGPITVREAAGNAGDTDYWVYDSLFNPLPGFGHDQPDAPGISRVLGAGTYYLAYGNFNTANNLGAPADEASRTASVTDFAGVIANSSSTAITNMNVEVVDGSGVVAAGVGSKASSFEIVWYRFTVVETGACCCGSTCSISSSSGCAGTNKLFVGAGSVCNLPGNLTSPCCLADFNHQAGVSVQDIFDFLAAFFQPDPCADISGSGLSPQDLFDFLAAYFSGCS